MDTGEGGCASGSRTAERAGEERLGCDTLMPMRVFGIDCGTEVTGYGVVESDDSGREPRLVLKAMGAIRLVKKPRRLPSGWSRCFSGLSAEMERWKPDAVAIEEVFYSVNAKSALKLGQVRGVALLAAATQGLPVAEYAPLKIKSSVVGYGLAKKEQVQFMVARLLELAEVPQPADAADALADCHLPHSYGADACAAREAVQMRAGVACCCMRGCCSLAWPRVSLPWAGPGRDAAVLSGWITPIPGSYPVALDADASPGWERAFPF